MSGSEGGWKLGDGVLTRPQPRNADERLDLRLSRRYATDYIRREVPEGADMVLSMLGLSDDCGAAPQSGDPR